VTELERKKGELAMNPRPAPTDLPASRRTRTKRLAHLAGACLALLSSAPFVHAASLPKVPTDLVVEQGFKLFRVEHAVGTQNFICRPKFPGPGFTWASIGPQATLFDNNGRQTLTHFLSANPDEDGEPRPTWQHSDDTSAVWAVKVEESNDPEFVEPGAIPWLLLEVVGAERGPNGGERLYKTAYIQRLNTSGGVVPTTGCETEDDLDRKALVPYEADYYFYKPVGRIE
jgi:hypothetical protein